MEVQAVELGSVSDLVSAVAWPIAVVVVAVFFRREFRELLRRDDVQVSAPGGLSISAKRQTAATDALEAAAKQQGGIVDSATLRDEVEAAAEEIAVLKRRPRILWADDQPSNNRYERAALEALDMTVDLSLSTEDALARVATRGPYDLIISDMSRPPDDRAGYTLLDALRGAGDQTPYVIYSGSRDPEHFNEAVHHGAVGCTNLASELFELVRSGLRANQR